MTDDNYSDWEDSNQKDYEINEEVITTDEVYQMFMAQQEQLQDTSRFLQLVLETMKQQHSPPADYQPFFIHMASKLQAINNQHHSIQKLLENQGNDIKSLDRLSDGLKDLKRTLNAQTKTFQELLGWRLAGLIALLVVPIGIGLMITLYFLIVQSNSTLEKKFDQFSTRSEKIWKKVK
jgi:hypothetical protein